MKYRLMGNSGLRVSELGLGAMTFGNQEWGAEKEDFELDPEDKARLDEVSQIELGFPHDFLAQFRTGSIVNHRA